MWMFSLLACRPVDPHPAAETFVFAVIGDRTDESWEPAWRKTFVDVEAQHPDLVLTVGDLADDALDPEDWALALEPAKGLSAPIEYVPGNHDILDEAGQTVFREKTGQAPYRSFDRGGVHFVVVDNSVAESWAELPEP